MKKDKLLALESLRGVAAISVAFHHLNIGSHFTNDFVSNAWLMVDFFFVLSGFVIALNYVDRIKNLHDVFKFQIKRFLRLYPLHFIMLIAFVGIEFLKYFAENKFGIMPSSKAFSENSLTAFLANLFLIQSWSLDQITFNYPSWSISAEFVTYALFAFLTLITKGNKTILSIILIPSIIYFGITLSEVGMGTGSRSGGPIRCLYSFSIGSLVYLIFRYFHQSGFSLGSFLPLSLIALCMYVVSEHGSKEFAFIIFIPLLFGVTIFSISLSRSDAYLNKALCMNWLVYLGSISYGIYMIHAFVWWVITRIMRFVIKVPTITQEDGTTRVLVENAYIADIISIIGILIIVLLADISYKFFEPRFRSN